MSKPKKTANIGKNFLYNTAYQILAMLIPLVTTPYAARIFGADGVGIQSYTNSAATIFAMFAALGVLSYGQREIAQHRDDKQQASRLFWEIELMCVITTSVVLVAWLIFSFLDRTYTPYFLLSSFTILAVAFDITWFFAGMEEFRFVVLRNSAVKLIGVAILFLAIREKSDLLLYVALLSATGFLGNITMWTYLPKFLDKVDWRSLRIFRHFRQTLVYFIPAIASSVYTVVDKAMLRFLTDGTAENGYYEQTTKIVRMAQVILLSINTVMTSRMSYLFAQGKIQEIKEKLEQSLSFILLLAFPFMLGIMGIAKNFVPWFFGDGYEPVIFLLCLYSPMLLIVGISNCLGAQYLTPSGQRGRSSKGIVAGALVNIVLNTFLIPRFGAAGATFASVIAELIIACVYFYMSRGFVSLEMLWHHTYKRLIAGAVMLGVVIALNHLPISSVLLTFLQVGIGALVYLVVLLLLRDSFILKGLNKVFAKLKKQ